MTKEDELKAMSQQQYEQSKALKQIAQELKEIKEVIKKLAEGLTPKG